MPIAHTGVTIKARPLFKLPPVLGLRTTRASQVWPQNTLSAAKMKLLFPTLSMGLLPLVLSIREDARRSPYRRPPPDGQDYCCIAQEERNFDQGGPRHRDLETTRTQCTPESNLCMEECDFGGQDCYLAKEFVYKCEDCTNDFSDKFDNGFPGLVSCGPFECCANGAFTLPDDEYNWIENFKRSYETGDVVINCEIAAALRRGPDGFGQICKTDESIVLGVPPADGKDYCCEAFLPDQRKQLESDDRDIGPGDGIFRRLKGETSIFGRVNSRLSLSLGDRHLEGANIKDCTPESNLCTEECFEYGNDIFDEVEGQLLQHCYDATGFAYVFCGRWSYDFPLEPCDGMIGCCATEDFTVDFWDNPFSTFDFDGPFDLEENPSDAHYAAGSIVIGCDTLAAMQRNHNGDTVSYQTCNSGSSSSAEGDPHFKTWSNRWYDFHGICDLVLLKAPDFEQGKGLEIHIRTQARYEYSYIESAAIKIGDEILEISSFGEHWLNGVESAITTDEDCSLAGYTIQYNQINKKKHSFTIGLGKSGQDALVVKTFKDLVAVNIVNATTASFGSSTGMMGRFSDGALVARNGETVMEDLNAFGEEWQVLGSEPQLFQATGVGPAEGCAVPVAKGRRLGTSVSLEAAELACAQWEGDQKDRCIFDVIAMGDLEVAEAHGAF